jgi:CRP-like cAMP-binding protein
MIYMLLTIVLNAWIIGSITLLVVKNDAATGQYRDTLERLEQYAKINEFDHDFHKDLSDQVILDYENRGVADESVLSHFPTAVRRKVLCRLYLPYLKRTSLMTNVRQQFVDAFLSTCQIEMFRPGEEILQRGNISLHLYLLVGGEVEVLSHGSGSGSNSPTSGSSSRSRHGPSKYIHAGEFLNEVGFFTDSPQIDTIRTVGVCKTLTISRSAYGLLADDHPGSAGRILQNLLAKVNSAVAALPEPLELLRAGSVFDQGGNGDSTNNDFDNSTRNTSERLAQLQTHSALTSIQDLVEMHISKQQDDHTTRFLFAASRGDIKTVSLMCDQGFDPNSADYDKRTALMVAAYKVRTAKLRVTCISAGTQQR